MEKDSNTAVNEVSKDVSKEVLIFGILTNKILSGVTVLGFSRSGDYMNKEFFDKKLEVYSIIDVVIDDIKEMIQKHAKDPVQMELILQQVRKIGLDQILFVIKILEHQEEDFGNIRTATDLFLIILRGNLAFQRQNSDTTFSKLLSSEEKDLMKSIFQLCKENLQDEDNNGVITGTVTEENIFLPDAFGTKLPLSFLKNVGIFEISPTRYDRLSLTAQHLSFVEFFASVEILLKNLDIKGSL